MSHDDIVPAYGLGTESVCKRMFGFPVWILPSMHHVATMALSSLFKKHILFQNIAFTFTRYLSKMTELRTADLSDEYSDILQFVEPIFRDYGAKRTFGGKISTVKCFEDNVLVKTALSEQGDGKVGTRCLLIILLRRQLQGKLTFSSFWSSCVGID